MLSKDDVLHRINMWQTVEQHIHDFFQSRGYTQIPRVPLMVRTPGMEPNLDPFAMDVQIPGDQTRRAGLITSPEYAMKKLLGAGFDAIYTITPVFRNGESLKPHNTPEFMMLEWYRVGARYDACMQETQDLINTLLNWSHEWPRIAYRDAHMDKHGDPGVLNDHDAFFVYEYPKEQAALAALHDSGTYAERFEAFVHGMELCNGFTELLDVDEQRRRFIIEQQERVEAGKEVFPIDEYLLAALDKLEGPIYGNALGVDRLVMLKYGVSDINQTQIFPATEHL